MNDAPIRVLGICGSLREGSFNRALLSAAARLAPAGMVIETPTQKIVAKMLVAFAEWIRRLGPR